MIHKKEEETFWIAGLLIGAVQIVRRPAEYSELQREVMAQVAQGIIDHWAFGNKICRRID